MLETNFFLINNNFEKKAQTIWETSHQVINPQQETYLPVDFQFHFDVAAAVVAVAVFAVAVTVTVAVAAVVAVAVVQALAGVLLSRQQFRRLIHAHMGK